MQSPPESSQAALTHIRRSRDTTILSASEFAELARAILFYLEGGYSPESAGDLAAEEVFPDPQRIGRDHETGALYVIKRD